MRYQVIGNHLMSGGDVDVLIEANSAAEARTAALALSIAPLAIAAVDPAPEDLEGRVFQDVPLEKRPIRLPAYRGLQVCAQLLAVGGIALPVLIVLLGATIWWHTARPVNDFGGLMVAPRAPASGVWWFLWSCLSAGFTGLLLFSAACVLRALRDLARSNHVLAQRL